MDILHDGIVNGFCIASSDSDYTSLALKVKEHGKFVLGLGRQSTHKSFTKACTRFIHLENLSDKVVSDITGVKDTDKPKQKSNAKKTDAAKKHALKTILLVAYEKVETNDIAHLSAMIEYIYKIDPSFDVRNYGFKQAIKAIESFPKDFSIERKINNVVIVKKIG